MNLEQTQIEIAEQEKYNSLTKKPMKVFKLKIIPAPWRGADAFVSRVDLEDALRRFPKPHETQGFVDSDGVFIGAETHNMPTYVLVTAETDDRTSRSPWFSGEQPVLLWSVNGAGECRWSVDPKGCHNKPDKQAIKAFGLV
jgi:hypothetical protein